jgi:hypothetical protein
LCSQPGEEAAEVVEVVEVVEVMRRAAPEAMLEELAGFREPEAVRVERREPAAKTQTGEVPAPTLQAWEAAAQAVEEAVSAVWVPRCSRVRQQREPGQD